MPARAFNLATPAFSLLTRGVELVTRRFEHATRGFKLVTRKFVLVTHGFELATRVLLFHLQNLAVSNLNFCHLTGLQPTYLELRGSNKFSARQY